MAVPEIKRRVYAVGHPLGPSIGEDVRCMKYALRRYESGLMPDPPYDRVFGKLMDEAQIVVRKAEHFTVRHYIDQEMFNVLWPLMDAYRKKKYLAFKVPVPPPPPLPEIVNPLPRGAGGYVCQGLHWTSGMSYNAAIDFCADPGTPILTVSDGHILYISGHDPSDDTWDTKGVYGWSVHYLDKWGYHHYLTHMGDPRIYFSAGQKIHRGQILGRVGNQRFRPDHLHQGVTSPKGIYDAISRIKEISKAPRVNPYEYP